MGGEMIEILYRVQHKKVGSSWYGLYDEIRIRRLKNVYEVIEGVYASYETQGPRTTYDINTLRTFSTLLDANGYALERFEKLQKQERAK